MASRRYTVLDAHGHVIAGGSAGGPVRWSARYRVYTLDFSRVAAPDLYTLRFAGRRSPRIRVAAAPALYRPLADAALAFLQSQRDGPETIPGAMRRVPSHLSDSSASVYRTPSDDMALGAAELYLATQQLASGG